LPSNPFIDQPVETTPLFRQRIRDNTCDAGNG